MNYILKKIGLILVLLFLLAACSGLSDEPRNPNDQDKDITLDDLTETGYFRTGALEHIFIGEINQRGDAVGFHYDGFPGKKGRVILGMKTPPDEFGVYEAGVKVNDVKKKSNGGKSSFFPDDWDAQQVIDTINEAYENRTLVNGNTYEGLTEAGMVIRMY